MAKRKQEEERGAAFLQGALAGYMFVEMLSNPLQWAQRIAKTSRAFRDLLRRLSQMSRDTFAYEETYRASGLDFKEEISSDHATARRDHRNGRVGRTRHGEGR